MKRYAKAFVRGFPVKEWPLYIGMIALFGMFGFLFITVASKHGGDVEAVKSAVKMLELVIWMYFALPFVYGLTSVGMEVYTVYNG